MNTITDWHNGLIEWESGGLNDISTELLIQWKQQLNEEITKRTNNSLYKEIIDLLEGIDKIETDHDKGWWETSTGADFGSKILIKLKKLFEGQ